METLLSVKDSCDVSSVDPNPLLNWIGLQFFQFSFSGIIAALVIAMGEVDTLGEKFGLGAVIAALGVLLGKYFAFRPKTIESQAAARRSDIQNIQEHNAALVNQINETNRTYVENLKQVNQEHVKNLVETINELKKTAALQRARADRNEAMLVNSRESKHTLVQGTARLNLQMQIWECLMTEAGIAHDPLTVVDMEAAFREEDAANKKLTDAAVETSQAAALATL